MNEESDDEMGESDIESEAKVFCLLSRIERFCKVSLEKKTA